MPRVTRRRLLVALLLGLALVAPPAGGLTVDGGSDAVASSTASTSFLFAEGTTRDGFQEYLSLLNPGDGTLTATITWDTVDALSGVRARPVTTLTIPPGRTTIDANRTVGADLDVGARVDASGPIVAERPLYFDAVLPGVGRVNGGSSVPGATAAEASHLFAEGTTRAGFQEYVTLANPSPNLVNATVTYDLVDAGTGARSRTSDIVSLPPGRTTLDVNAKLGAGRDVAISVAANAPVVAERPTYFATSFAGTGPLDGGTVAAGSTRQESTALFAEGTTRAGFQEYLTLLNPLTGTLPVSVTYDTTTPTGERERRTATETLPPGRTTIDVNAAVGPSRDVSIAVAAPSPLAAERPVYFHSVVAAAGDVSGGSAVPGPARASPVQLLAEGTTRAGFQEYLTLANPGAFPVTATITWDVVEAAGGRRSRFATPLTLPAGRTTVDVNATVGPERDVSVRVDAGGGILAERPQYFRHEFGSGTELRTAVVAALADPRWAGATVGVSIWVQGYGEIAGQQADTPLTPASTEKLFTGAGAMEVLGPAIRLSTELRAGATPSSGSVINGDLFLVGGGDPSLASLGPNSLQVLADGLRTRGVNRVTGRLVGDESRYDGARTAPGWKPTYLTEEDVGPLTALGVDYDTGHGDDPGYLANPVAGNLDVMRRLLSDRGIAVDGPNALGPAPAGAVVLVSTTSAPYSTLLRDMLTFSDNFTAELAVKEIGRRARSAGTTADGLAAMDEALDRAGLPDDGDMADGSGLSVLDRRSASTERRLLQAVQSRGWWPTYNAALAQAGRTGTLVDRFKGTPAEANLRGKSGSIAGVRCLAGHMTTLGGRRVVFSVMVNGPSVGNTARDAIDQLVARVASDRS